MSDLAERLGYSPDARLAIVNCDDFGSSHAANTAILRSLETGVATSATLMVPCPWAREAARMADGHDVGVHLTLTAEYPAYRWRSLTGAASLHDDDGFLPATAPGAIARATPDDVRAECRAQIDQALAWGVDVTHLDSHMGVNQIHAPFFDIYVDLAVEYRLPLRMFGSRTDRFLGFSGKDRARERGVLFADSMLDSFGLDTRTLWMERVPRLRDGVTEVFGHPVDDGPELRGYDPDSPQQRVNDGLLFTDPATRALFDTAAVTRISYRSLRELQRGVSPGN
jgi:hypothetical protein